MPKCSCMMAWIWTRRSSRVRGRPSGVVGAILAGASSPSSCRRASMQRNTMSRNRASPCWCFTVRRAVWEPASPFTVADWLGCWDRSQAAQASRSSR